MIVIDKLCYQSNLRYVNPYIKFSFALLTLIFCLVSRSTGMGLFVIAVNSLLITRAGGISARRYGRLLLVPLAFLLLSTLAIMLNLSKTPLDAFAFPVGSFYITGSYASIARSLQLIVTAMASVTCLYFLSLNTTMTDILAVLRRLHMPALLCELMLLIYRYIFVLLDAGYYISTSQEARLGNRNYKTSIHSFASMAQALFIRAMKRSRSLYDAMEARGYDGQLRVLDESRPAEKKHILMVAIFEALLFAVTVYTKVRG